MKKLSITLMTLAWLGWLSGCNTVEGFGKDMQKAGEKIEETAKKK
ncbi:MAG TPA: entericidin A/B family lipoprotein [Ideonella sp.]|nr:entericidin A/B family lipoprotein [Ideonella sp.]HEX5686560.1 entericidin A/B family lipoprotein [Ideonella sp.]